MVKDTKLNGHTSPQQSASSTNGNVERPIKSHTKKMNGNSDNKLSSMSIEEQFKAAVNVIQNLPKNGSFQPSDQLKLKFYAFYKQATEGPNQTPKPSFYEIVNRYKWDAWTKLGNMSKKEAMQNYVNELKQIVETMPYNASIAEFYDQLGPFFEFKKDRPKRTNGLSHESKTNGNHQFTKDVDYSSSSDSESESDFSDTVDNLPMNRALKPDLRNANEKKNSFEDCMDANSKLQPGDLINARGTDAGYLTGQENYFYDCIDKNSMLNLNDIICARGEIGIFSTPANLSTNQDESNSQSFRQSLSIDNEFRSIDDSYYQSSGAGSGGGDRNYNNQHSELSDIHEHLALTVLRLQQTVKSISNRIENLETRVNERQSENRKEIKKQSWWSNRTTQTTVLLIIWPFAAHLIISAIKKKVNK